MAGEKTRLMKDPLITRGWIRAAFDWLRVVSKGVDTYWTRRFEMEFTLSQRTAKNKKSIPAKPKITLIVI